MNALISTISQVGNRKCGHAKQDRQLEVAEPEFKVGNMVTEPLSLTVSLELELPLVLNLCSPHLHIFLPSRTLEHSLS